MDSTSIFDPIDYPSALERTGGDPEFLEELLDLYIEDFENKYPQLKKAVEARNGVLIRELAHGLKGSSANLSLLALQDIFFRLEMAGYENRPEDAVKTLPLLQVEYERLKTFLKKNNV